MERYICLICTILLLQIGYAQNDDSEQDAVVAQTLNFEKPVHSLGVALLPSLGFTSRVKCDGPICPETHNNLAPEFCVHYSCLFPNNFGFTIEVPFGMFQRNAYFNLQSYGKTDIPIEEGAFYVGFSPKLAYYKQLGKKCIMQVETGLKFLPFVYPASYWENVSYDYPNSEMIYFEMSQRAYIFPDITASVLFMFHNKKHSRNHFVIGLSGSLSYVTRMSITYDTQYSDLSNDLYTKGSLNWNSSMIGIVIGYRFLGLKP